MKKKFIVVMISALMITTMIPLESFASEKNESTPVGDTGIELVGEEPAVEGQDYKVEEKTEKSVGVVTILTDGWKIEGASEYSLKFVSSITDTSNKFELGNLEVNSIHFDKDSEAAEEEYPIVDVSVTGNTTVAHEISFDEVETSFQGDGVLTTANIDAVDTEKVLTFDLAQVNVVGETKGKQDRYLISAQKIDFLSGQVNVAASGAAVGIVANTINVSKESDLFVAASMYSIVVKESNIAGNLLGSSRTLAYAEKEKINEEIELRMGEDLYGFKTFFVKGTEKESKTFYNQLYRVELDFQDGEHMPQVTAVEYGETVTKPADPSKEGYKFLGWYDNLEGRGEAFNFETPITKNTVLYADWDLEDEPTPVPPGPEPTPVPPGPEPVPAPINPTVNPGTGATSNISGDFKTGDTEKITLFAGLGLITIIAMMVMVLNRRKKSK